MRPGSVPSPLPPMPPAPSADGGLSSTRGLRPRAGSTLAWIAALGIPVAFAALVIGTPPPDRDAWAVPLYGTIVSTWLIAGAFLVTRRPGNPVGWVLFSAGLLIGLAMLGQLWAYSSFVLHDGSLPGTLAGALLGVLFLPGVYLTLLIPFLFPDGRLLPARGWHIVPVAIIGGAAASVFALLVAPGPLEGMDIVENPLGVEALGGVSQTITEMVGVVMLAAIPLGIVATVLRYRRGTMVERKQLQWFGSVTALWLSMFFLATFLPQPFGQLAWIVASLGLGLVPVAIGIAVMRYRLYEIDRIVSRTLSYAVVTGVLALVFVGTNLALQAAVSSTIGGGSVAVAASTLLVAGLFQPLRRRIQATVDHRFNRRRESADRVSAEFARTARDELDLAKLGASLVHAVEQSVAPTGSAVWLRRTP